MFENDNNNTGMENFQSDGFETTVSGVENVTKKAKGRKAALIGGISAAVIAGGTCCDTVSAKPWACPDEYRG